MGRHHSAYPAPVFAVSATEACSELERVLMAAVARAETAAGPDGSRRPLTVPIVRRAKALLDEGAKARASTPAQTALAFTTEPAAPSGQRLPRISAVAYDALAMAVELADEGDEPFSPQDLREAGLDCSAQAAGARVRWLVRRGLLVLVERGGLYDRQTADQLRVTEAGRRLLDAVERPRDVQRLGLAPGEAHGGDDTIAYLARARIRCLCPGREDTPSTPETRAAWLRDGCSLHDDAEGDREAARRNVEALLGEAGSR